MSWKELHSIIYYIIQSCKSLEELNIIHKAELKEEVQMASTSKRKKGKKDKASEVAMNKPTNLKKIKLETLAKYENAIAFYS